MIREGVLENPEPQYVADPSARGILDRLAASTGGAVYSEDEVGAATRKTKALLGSGPTVVEGQNAGKVALAPYLAVVALFAKGECGVRSGRPGAGDHDPFDVRHVAVSFVASNR